MFNLKSTLIAIFALTVSAASASAGTEVFNRYETQHQYNGYSETNVDAHIYTETTTNIDSISIKSETEQ